MGLAKARVRSRYVSEEHITALGLRAGSCGFRLRLEAATLPSVETLVEGINHPLAIDELHSEAALE